MKILIVDDDDWQRELIRDNLPDQTEIFEADSALVAIDILDQNSIDVMFLDLSLIGGSCFSLLNEMQSDAELAKVPVILCSNLAEKIAGLDLKSYGIQKIVDKAEFNPKNTWRIVQSVL